MEQRADENLGLYTDESPGLKVDPVVVMTLSVVFIFSVVALHGLQPLCISGENILTRSSHRQGHAPIFRIEKRLDGPPVPHWHSHLLYEWRSAVATSTLLSCDLRLHISY